MLYQCEVGGLAPEEALEAFPQIEHSGERLSPEGRDFAARIALGTARSVDEVDPLIAASAENWRPARMAVIDRLILRQAVYQFLHMPDVPRAVVIDEAVELAREFGGGESDKFVNGVLDAIKKKIEQA
jgi:transcription antitermination protein NusB